MSLRQLHGDVESDHNIEDNDSGDIDVNSLDGPLPRTRSNNQVIDTK